MSLKQNTFLRNLCMASALSFLFGITSNAQEINVTPEANTVTGRTAMTISYPEGPSLSVKLKGSERLPKASGEAKVQRKRGTTEIEIELDEMKPATSFGGDFATYVLWAVTPQAQVDNIGEFVLRGNRSKLNVSTSQQTFALFVTAEPHFMVRTPSRFVVLETTRPINNITGQMLDTSAIKYRGYEGTYNFRRETLVGEAEVKGEVRSDVRQAIVAVKLAERAGALEFANAELTKARVSLEKTLEANEANVDPRQLMVMGHETVRLAVEAEKLAQERAYQAALQNERTQRAMEINSLKISIEKSESDAERLRLEQQHKQLELDIERSARESAQAKADESARLAAEEMRKREAAEQLAAESAKSRALAEQQAQQLAQDKLRAEQQADESAKARALAEQQAQQLNQDKLRAEQQAAELAKAREAAALAANQAQSEADRVKRERDEAKNRLQVALSAIVETRTTARGIIVNLPDILFAVNRAELVPQAKETLSRICGIMQVAGDYDLSIEGHTDSTGSNQHNQTLSEKRAQSVFTYLSSCGLQNERLASKGFGETQPLESNDTIAGRKKNRRVEIVIKDQVAAVGSTNQ